MAAKRHSSSIAALPLELMRDIVSLVVVSADRRDLIMILSQVSQKFRLAVLDMSWLFTEADWNKWPTPFLDLWCQRARIQPLTVYVTSPTIRRLSDGRAPELRALLESCSQRWGSLRLDINDLGACIAHFLGQFLHRGCPSLHTLSLSRNNHAFHPTSTIHLQIDRFPLLRALHLDGVWPDFSQPPVSATELAFICEYVEEWTRSLHLVQSCQLIQRLTIDSRGYSVPTNSFPTTKVILPSLIYLELRGLGAGTAGVTSRFLGCCDVPNLESLVIQPALDFWVAEMGKVLCQIVAPHIPGIKYLTINCYPTSLYVISSELLKSLTKHPIVFPHLTELRLLASDRVVVPCYLARIIQNFLHFREGIITHLAIPPFRDEKVTESLKKSWSCLEVPQLPRDVIARLAHRRLPGRRSRRKGR